MTLLAGAAAAQSPPAQQQQQPQPQPQQQQPVVWERMPRMQLEAEFAGPLKDTTIQRWRDPSGDAVCYLYLPFTAQHSPPTATGYVQYGANTIGAISCVPGRPPAVASAPPPPKPGAAPAAAAASRAAPPRSSGSAATTSPPAPRQP